MIKNKVVWVALGIVSIFFIVMMVWLQCCWLKIASSQGWGDPNYVLHISLSWVEISLHFEFHPPGLPRSGRFMIGDKTTTTTTKFHGFNGFLSLQLGLSFELGLRLRLTNNIIIYINIRHEKSTA